MRTSRKLLFGTTILALTVGFCSPLRAQYALTPSGWNNNAGGKLEFDGVRTGRLTGDLTGTITVTGIGLILDGNGHSLTATSSGDIGITITALSNNSGQLTAVKVQNFSNVSGFARGIQVWSTTTNGIDSCIVRGNTVTGCGSGIDLAVPRNGWFNRNNVVEDNTLVGNTTGIAIASSTGDLVSHNTVQNSKPYGLYLSGVSNTEVFNNSFISNPAQVSVSNGSGNSFNKPAPLGGNFWSDWTSPDNNHDGFVDNPYTVSAPADALPWTTKDGWTNLVDLQPPVTTASLNGTAGIAGWYVSDVSVTLTAIDYPQPGGSGVKLTQYSTDGATWQAAPVPTITAEGTMTLYYRSTDLAGNVESAKNIVIKIDKTPPSIVVSRSPVANQNGWINADVTASYSATDGGSGLASPESGSFIFSSEGQGQSHTFVVTDEAGNQALAVIDRVNIDKTAPVIGGPAGLAFGNDPGLCSRSASNTNLQVSISDNLSGIATSINNAPATYTGGTTSVTWTATDKAGNASTKTQSVTINDVELPVIVPPANITSLVNNGKCGAVVNFPAPTVTDNCSGVAFSLDHPSGSTFPEGLTVVRIKATDGAGNTTTSAFTVTVVNTPPAIGTITVPQTPIAVKTAASLSAIFADPDPNDPHTATWQWGDGTSTDGVVGQNTVSGNHAYAQAGLYTVQLTVTDGCGVQAETTYQYIVVYDPNGGFVTGGGWISSPAGAYAKDAAFTGKPSINFASKYLPGCSVPSGNNDFQLKPSLKFSGTGYEWLVISGAKAVARGTGTINGTGIYGFLLASVDGRLEGSKKADRFRIKIWDKISEALFYDNQPGAADDADPATVVGGGSLVVHRADAGTNTASAGLSAELAADEGTAVVIPTEYALYNSYPNPFNPSTTIRFDLPEATKVRLVVYDMLGREAAVLVDGERPAGQYSVRFEAGKLSSGMYIYRLQAGNFVQTKKLVLMK